MLPDGDIFTNSNNFNEAPEQRLHKKGRNDGKQDRKQKK